MNFDCTKSKIWQGVNRNLLIFIGVKRNLLKLLGGKPKFAKITGSEIFHEGPKPKNLQITRMKFKKKILQKENPKLPIL